MRKYLGLGLCLLGAVPAMASATQNRLAQAVRSDDHAAIKSLLAAHANVNAPLPDKSSVLAWAVDRQDADSVHMLLAAGAKPNVTGIDGASPLTLACELGSPEIVADILRAAQQGAVSLPGAAGCGRQQQECAPGWDVRGRGGAGQ